jgi:Fur family zinc uptake transcriptional regulator
MASRKKPVEKEMEILEERGAGSGYAPTRLRRLVLKLLVEAKGPVKAYEMVETAQAQGQRLTPATCYRVLEHLRSAGLVHKVNSLNSFVVCTDRGLEADHHPLILVCPDCRKATEISDSGLSEALFGRLSALGHEVASGSVEIHGLCNRCAAK